MFKSVPAKYRDVVRSHTLARIGDCHGDFPKQYEYGESPTILFSIVFFGVVGRDLHGCGGGLLRVYVLGSNSSAPAEVALLEANSSTGFVDAVTRTDVSGFLAELYFKSRSGVDSKFFLLSFFFDRIEGAFFNRDLQRVEALLDEFDPTRTLDIVSVSVFRSTFRAKNRFKFWDGCLARVIKHLNDSGKDWKRQLRGLVGFHDTFVRTSYSTVF